MERRAGFVNIVFGEAGRQLYRPGNKVTLRWLESCVESARCRKEERLIALLEIVRAEIVFEIQLAGLRNEQLAKPKNENLLGS